MIYILLIHVILQHTLSCFLTWLWQQVEIGLRLSCHHCEVSEIGTLCHMLWLLPVWLINHFWLFLTVLCDVEHVERGSSVHKYNLLRWQSCRSYILLSNYFCIFNINLHCQFDLHRYLVVVSNILWLLRRIRSYQKVENFQLSFGDCKHSSSVNLA